MSLRLRSPRQDAIARAKHKDLQKRWRRGEAIFPDQTVPRSGMAALAAVDAFMATRKGKVAPTTWQTDFNRLKRLCAQTGVSTFRDLKRAGVEEFLAGVLEKGAKTTYNQYMLITRAFLAYCVRKGWARDNPLDGARVLEPDQPEISYLDKKARAAVLKASRKDYYRALVDTAIYAGPRFGELVHLDLRDVDLKRRLLAVRKTKTRRGRSVPLDRKLVTVLRSHIAARRKAGAKERDPLFTPDASDALPASYREKIMSGRIGGYLNHYIEDLSKRSGQPCGWNIFRHTFGSLLAQQGVSLYQIAEWMGNSPNVCRRHYAALSGEWSDKIEVR